MTDILDTDILDDNLDFLSRVALKPHMTRIIRALFQEELQLADLQTDIIRVEADLDTETQEVTMLQGNVVKIADAQKASTDTLAANTQTIADLNKEVAALKAANPGVDTTSLEAKIAQFEQNNIDLDQQNRALGGLIPAAPAPPVSNPATGMPVAVTDPPAGTVDTSGTPTAPIAAVGIDGAGQSA